MSQAIADVSPVVLLFMVRCSVTVLSHPIAFCVVNVGVLVEAVNVVPCHAKLSQAVAVVSLVVATFTVNCNVVIVSQRPKLVTVFTCT